AGDAARTAGRRRAVARAQRDRSPPVAATGSGTIRRGNPALVAAHPGPRHTARVDGAIPLTKFRVPRLRRDTVPRAPLLARLLQSVEANPLTIVRAPGGSGKTVLLSQLVAAIGDSRKVLWVAL